MDEQITLQTRQNPLRESESEHMFNRYYQAGNRFYQKYYDITSSKLFLDQALNEYAKALELKPDHPDVLAQMAQVFLKKGRYDQAEKYVRKALAFDPSNAIAHQTQGFIHSKHKSYHASIQSLSNALKANSKSKSHLHHGLFRNYKALTKSAEGLKETVKYSVLGSYHRMVAIGLFPFQQNRICLSAFAVGVPGLVRAYVKEQNSDLDGALEELLDIYNKLPGLPALINTIAGMFRMRGQYDEATYWYTKAVKRNPQNEEALYQLAALYEESAEYEMAIETYARLLELMPQDGYIHCSLGNLYYQMQDLDKTISYYRSALQLGTDDQWKAMVANSLASLYQEHEQNLEAAQSLLQYAISLNPKESEYYIQLGLLHFMQNQYDNAQVVYEQALTFDAGNARLYSNLGYLKWISDDISEAVRLYEKAIAVDPEYEIAYNNLGAIQLDYMGNIPRAIELLKVATDLNPEYALGFYNLGRAFSFLDKKVEAATCFQHAQYLNEYTQELDNEELQERLFNLFNSPEVGS